MGFHLRTSLAALGVTASFLACASLAGIEQPSPSPVRLDAAEGTAVQTRDGVTISPTELVLPPIQCSEAQSGTISITNNGPASVPYEVNLPRSATFSLRGATEGSLAGSLAPAGFAFVYVDAKGVRPGPQAVDLVMKVGTTVQAINVKLDVKGGLLTASPSLVDFGDVQQNLQSPVVPIELKNDGNEQISVTGFSGLTSDFVFSKATVVVPAGGIANVDVFMTPGAASNVAPQIEVRPQVVGPGCSIAPSFTLKGKRVNQDVTVGPLSADLGDVYCGTTPSKRATVSVKNYSVSSATTYEAKLLSPTSRFEIVSGASGSLPEAVDVQTPSKADIVIGAKEVGVPLGEFDEDLQIHVGAPLPGGTTRIVKLHIGAYGALVEASPVSLGGFALNETKWFSLKNVGNARTCVAYSSVSAEGFAIETDDTLNPDEDNDLRVEFNAGAPGTYTSSIQIARLDCPGVSAPICAPPAPVSVSATR